MRAMRIASAVAIGLAAGMAASGAVAEEGVLMKSILGTIGIVPGDRPAIDYRERAPLVLPPRIELREPGKPATAQARNGQWPSDPDVAASERQQAEARLPAGESEVRRMNDRALLSAQEIQGGRRQTSAYSRPQPGKVDKESHWIRPDYLRTRRTGDDDTSVLADGEPQRTRLAEPPPGMRKPLAGAPVRADSEPVVREDDANPLGFIRQQAGR